MTAEIWASFLDVRMLRRDEEEPGARVRSIAAAEGVGAHLSTRELSVNRHLPAQHPPRAVPHSS
jgi:hypothetical protein